MLSLLAALQFSRFEGHLRGAHRGGGAVGGGQLPVRPCPAWAGPCLVESFEERPQAWIDRTGVSRIARVESLDKRRAHTFQAFGQLTFETHLSTPGRSGLGKSGPESASRHQPLSTSASVVPSSAGLGETRMPASSIAAILSSALPCPQIGRAHV